jgi:hypothetical protein
MKIYNIFNTFLSENMDENRKKSPKNHFLSSKNTQKSDKKPIFYKKS